MGKQLSQPAQVLQKKLRSRVEATAWCVENDRAEVQGREVAGGVVILARVQLDDDVSHIHCLTAATFRSKVSGHSSHAHDPVLSPGDREAIPDQTNLGWKSMKIR